MKKKKIEGPVSKKIREMKAQKETEAAVETIDSVPEPNVEVIDEEIKLSAEEKIELADNSDYLEHSAEVVGYANREIQWDAYHAVVNYINLEDSILDFGCGRGDFERFCRSEYDIKPDYLGIDMNKQLVDASKTVYNKEVNIQNLDWFELDKNVRRDWCINIGSNNLRYDADTTRDDEKYLHDTIDTMMSHADKGILLLLASDNIESQDGLINWNAGKILDWSIKKYSNVAVDHSISDEIFVLIIYKN